MPTTELFVVDSAGVAKRVSKLSARFYRYKKQIAADNMDPSMPRVSVDATHPTMTAAHRHSGKAATERETPPTRTPNPQIPSSSGEGYIHPRSALDWLVAVPPWLVLVLHRRVAAWDRQVLVVGVI
jgi:hypothetical protein